MCHDYSKSKILMLFCIKCQVRKFVSAISIEDNWLGNEFYKETIILVYKEDY